jgi:hypothetical protein
LARSMGERPPMPRYGRFRLSWSSQVGKRAARSSLWMKMRE